LGDRVVGVTSFCNYPPEVKKKPRIDTYWEFNLEAILALKPDLVLAMAHQGEGESALNVLSHWKIPYYVGHADTLPQLFQLIEKIAQITGTEEVPRRKLANLMARARRVEARVRGLHRPPVLMKIDQEPLISVGRSSFQGDLIQRAGGENIANGIAQRYPMLSLEKVLMSQPQIILFTGMAEATTLPARKKYWCRWDMLLTAKTGRLLWIDLDLVDRPGPRLVDGLELLADFFHPQK
jgi:iron complex transport system substrate-binding protein